MSSFHVSAETCFEPIIERHGSGLHLGAHFLENIW